MLGKISLLTALMAGIGFAQAGCINLVWSPSRCQCKDGKCCGEHCCEAPPAVGGGAPPSTPPVAIIPPQEKN